MLGNVRAEHRREHRSLGSERICVGRGEGSKVARHNGLPAAGRRRRERLRAPLAHVHALNHRAPRLARLYRNHHQMLLQPVENLGVGRVLNLERPIPLRVIVAREPRYANSYRILRPADNSVVPLGVVLKAERQFGHHLRRDVGQLHRPHFFDDVAGGGGQATSFAHVEGRLEGNCECPTSGVTVHIRLVDPRSSEVEAGRNLAGSRFEGCRRAGLKAFGWLPFKDHVFNPPLGAKFPFRRGVAVCVDHENVWFEDVASRYEVHNSASAVNHGVLHVTDSLHHIQAFVLTVDRRVVLILKDCGVGADSHVQIAILRCLAEKLHMPRMKQVVAPTHKNFLSHIITNKGETFSPTIAIFRLRCCPQGKPGRPPRSLPTPAGEGGWPIWPLPSPNQSLQVPPRS